MTTKIKIENDPSSNPGQHVLISHQYHHSAPKHEVRLAPGEGWEAWISDTWVIDVKEVFAPKPVPELADGSDGSTGNS